LTILTVLHHSNNCESSRSS